MPRAYKRSSRALRVPRPATLAAALACASFVPAQAAPDAAAPAKMRPPEQESKAEWTGPDEARVHNEVRRLVAALNETMVRMQNLMASQRTFIDGASHQLRTPLTVLKIQAELALRENDPAEMRGIVRSIASTTDSTIRLVNRLLTLARIGHRSGSAHVAPVPLAAVAGRVALELAPPAVQKGIDLAFEVEDGIDTTVSGQEQLLHELVFNLADNAIRYTPPGGNVVLRVARQASHVLLEVLDSGPGIAPEEYDKVFVPFYRAQATLHINPDGSGLGLAIVRDIANLHGAALALDRRDGDCGLKVSLLFATPAGPQQRS